jgi:hypothetical protein
MNREILFRGKPIDQKWWLENFERFSSMEEWAIGNLIVSDEECWIVGGIADVDDEYIAHEWWVKIRPETVGQYTGMTDESKSKIFEGDLYRSNGGYIFEVVYLESEACFVGVPVDYPKEWTFLEDVAVMERVGNKWDNPELLGVD